MPDKIYYFAENHADGSAGVTFCDSEALMQWLMDQNEGQDAESETGEFEGDNLRIPGLKTVIGTFLELVVDTFYDGLPSTVENYIEAVMGGYLRLVFYVAAASDDTVTLGNGDVYPFHCPTGIPVAEFQQTLDDYSRRFFNNA